MSRRTTDHSLTSRRGADGQASLAARAPSDAPFPHSLRRVGQGPSGAAVRIRRRSTLVNHRMAGRTVVGYDYLYTLHADR